MIKRPVLHFRKLPSAQGETFWLVNIQAVIQKDGAEPMEFSSLFGQSLRDFGVLTSDFSKWVWDHLPMMKAMLNGVHCSSWVYPELFDGEWVILRVLTDTEVRIARERARVAFSDKATAIDWSAATIDNLPR